MDNSANFRIKKTPVTAFPAAASTVSPTAPQRTSPLLRNRKSAHSGLTAHPSLTHPTLAAHPNPTRPLSVTSPARTGLRLEDLLMINNLAANQLRYGQPQEAIVLLQLSHYYNPQNPATLRLLTQSFIALKDWSSAEKTSMALGALGEDRSAQWLLTRAVIARGLNRIRESYDIFVAFLAKRTETEF